MIIHILPPPIKASIKGGNCKINIINLTYYRVLEMIQLSDAEDPEEKDDTAQFVSVFLTS